MQIGEILRIAYRYTLGFGRGHLSVFMASVSMLGLVLATALLLTVLSVMNGFEREMRERILALVPHVTVHAALDAQEAEALAQRLAALPEVDHARPFVSFQGMAVRGAAVTTVAALGLETLPTGLTELVSLPELNATDGVILGDSVAQRLGVAVGEQLTLIVPPRGAYRQAGIQTQRIAISAIVDTGTELDEAFALLPLELASRLSGLGGGVSGGVSGVQLSYEDPFEVDSQLSQLRQKLPPGSYATSWRMTHGNLYSAIQLSRDLVVLLLTSIIGVAAFNVVSALVLIVIDQRSAIAILRTVGATPSAMALLFIAQGLIIGVIGSVLGCVLGAVLCQLLPDLVAGLEALLEFRFLNTDVYPVSFIPVDLRITDALLIAGVAIVMCVLAALYPALRAARLEPASVLHQDS